MGFKNQFITFGGHHRVYITSFLSVNSDLVEFLLLGPARIFTWTVQSTGEPESRCKTCETSALWHDVSEIM